MPQGGDELVRAAAGCEPPVSPAVRQLCAARLLAGIDSVAKRAAAMQRPQQAAPGAQAGRAAGAADGQAGERVAQERRDEAAALVEIATYVGNLQERSPVRSACGLMLACGTCHDPGVATVPVFMLWEFAPLVRAPCCAQMAFDSVSGHLQGLSLAAELPEELLTAVSALRALAAKASKASQKAGVTPEAAAQQRCAMSSTSQKAGTGCGQTWLCIFRDSAFR